MCNERKHHGGIKVIDQRKKDDESFLLIKDLSNTEVSIEPKKIVGELAQASSFNAFAESKTLFSNFAQSKEKTSEEYINFPLEKKKVFINKVLITVKFAYWLCISNTLNQMFFRLFHV